MRAPIAATASRSENDYVIANSSSSTLMDKAMEAISDGNRQKGHDYLANALERTSAPALAWTITAANANGRHKYNPARALTDALGATSEDPHTPTRNHLVNLVADDQDGTLARAIIKIDQEAGAAFLNDSAVIDAIPHRMTQACHQTIHRHLIVQDPGAFPEWKRHGQRAAESLDEARGKDRLTMHRLDTRTIHAYTSGHVTDPGAADLMGSLSFAADQRRTMADTSHRAHAVDHYLKTGTQSLVLRTKNHDHASEAIDRLIRIAEDEAVPADTARRSVQGAIMLGGVAEEGALRERIDKSPNREQMLSYAATWSKRALAQTDTAVSKMISEGIQELGVRTAAKQSPSTRLPTMGQAPRYTEKAV